MKLAFMLPPIAAGSLVLSASVVPPAKATVVYVTYTGTVVRGTDPGGIFGQPGSLNGKSFEVDYVFDTGTFADSSPTENFLFGGTAFGSPSPLLGPAVLTIGGLRIRI